MNCLKLSHSAALSAYTSFDKQNFSIRTLLWHSKLFVFFLEEERTSSHFFSMSEATHTDLRGVCMCAYSHTHTHIMALENVTLTYIVYIMIYFDFNHNYCLLNLHLSLYTKKKWSVWSCCISLSVRSPYVILKKNWIQKMWTAAHK